MLDGAFSMIVIALPIIRLQHYFEGIYLYQELYCGHRVTFSKYLYWNSLKLHHWPAALILCTIRDADYHVIIDAAAAVPTAGLSPSCAAPQPARPPAPFWGRSGCSSACWRCGGRPPAAW